MSLPRTFILGSISLFGLIGFLGVVKKIVTGGSKSSEVPALVGQEGTRAFPADRKLSSPILVNGAFPKVERIGQLFDVKQKGSSIVQTITYASSVPWLKGRPAWISDYANHYSTPCSFIARSLTGKTDYRVPKVFEGNKFNVFCADRPIQFYLVVDLSRCQMGLYYYEMDKDERRFLKAYPVGLGKRLGEYLSMTPRGLFPLGSQVGIYNKGDIGYHLDKKVKMVQVFGTRWLPFEGKGAKGIGIQGAPWIEDLRAKELKEDASSIGKYESDGCIRMKQKDIEELYAIIVTKPTFIEVVNDACEAELPGKEVNTSSGYK